MWWFIVVLVCIACCYLGYTTVFWFRSCRGAAHQGWQRTEPSELHNLVGVFERKNMLRVFERRNMFCVLQKGTCKHIHKCTQIYTVIQLYV